ncbi:hypothetical protein BDF20DRAFT_823931 [Mycotypha africana]|uniref:uncharacterized protein n=1 Tax=Mycotypha africana TaxID=64632 RepID=UPI002301FD1C|nr:uncharacterized protein BDF20DRAFT_823931 [Mycotypha africana]KAI8973791.1 hypothetical protein BDF20DRAFT_823931 [Mycotypha africana]
MVTITRQQALCMFFIKEYTEENVKKLEKKLEEIEDVEICYIDDPTEPVLINKVKIIQNPFRFQSYIGNTQAESNELSAMNNRNQLLTNAQVKQFLNLVYLPINPNNALVYDCKTVSMKQILSLVWNYCELFDDNTVNSFSKWCSHQKLDLLEMNAKRINSTDDSQRIRTRSLYVLKSEYLGKKNQKKTNLIDTFKDSSY